MPTPRALITGITGQTGSYLAEFLLARGYEVHGVIRRSSSFNTGRIDHIYQDPHELQRRLVLHFGDVTDAVGLTKVVRAAQPDEVYNLAAQSHVRVSFDLPIATCEATAMGTLNLLEAVRQYQEDSSRPVRFFQASTSEMYGNAPEFPQRESTPFMPRSPYAAAKVFAHWATVNYREAYGLHASCGIMFNHESPRRGETFVTRKITRAATRMKLGLQDRLYLGNLDARRDWGFAGDYARAMWMMLQCDRADDYVIATGRSASVREFLDMVFAEVGLNPRDKVEYDERYLRPSEVDALQGDASKLARATGWKPEVDLAGLVKMMVAHDMELAQREKTLREAGHALTPRRSGSA